MQEGYNQCPTCRTWLAKCYRCGHEWLSHQKKKPLFCANHKCCSPYWDRPRKKPKKQAEQA